MKNYRHKKRARGSILLLSIFFLIVLFSLAVAFFRIIPAEFHSAANSRRHIQATYAADAGVRNAVTWLKATWAANQSHIISDSDIVAFNGQHFGSNQPGGIESWPVLDASNPKLQAHKVDDEGWSYLTHISKNESSDFFLRVYDIESAAYFRGRPVSVAKATVQNESFARFALLIDKWNSSFIYAMQPNGIQGPAHTNDFFRISAPNADFWTATQVKGGVTVPADPWISGPLARMTQSGSFNSMSTDPANTLGIDGDGVQYANGNSFQANYDLVPFDGSGTPIAERYEKIVEGGRESITQIAKIPMPESNTDLRLKAWGDTLPTNNSQWNAAVNGAGTVLVNTDSGHPNDPNGKVTGGIFIRGTNAGDLVFDLTEEGHQVTKVRQGTTTVADPSNVTYWADVPQYHRPVVHPARTENVTTCVEWSYRQEPNYRTVTHSEQRTEANATYCGTHQEYVPGDGGVNQPIQVPNVCTFTYTWTTSEPDGTYRSVRDRCIRSTTNVVHHPEWTEWVPAEPGDAGAQPTGGTAREEVNPDYPGAEAVVGTRSIENWNSVVEVNDSSYKIPFHPGMKVNGETITSASDPRLTVTDGHTVTIKNDIVTGGVDYAEYTVMEGRVNGVVYGDVHLYNVRGTVKGSKYSAGSEAPEYRGKVLTTNIAGGKNIEIKDSILQYYDGADPEGDLKEAGHNRLAVGKTSPNQDHILGIFANEILIKPSGRSNTYENTDTAWRENGNVAGRPFRGGKFKGGINVYGILMAGRVDSKGNSIGGFGAHNNAMDSNDHLGDFNLFGGIISAHAKLTQKTAGGHANGFRLQLNYDQIAAEFLEYFPPTNIFNCLRYVIYPATENS